MVYTLMLHTYRKKPETEKHVPKKNFKNRPRASTSKQHPPLVSRLCNCTLVFSSLRLSSDSCYTTRHFTILILTYITIKKNVSIPKKVSVGFEARITTHKIDSSTLYSFFVFIYVIQQQHWRWKHSYVTPNQHHGKRPAFS